MNRSYARFTRRTRTQAPGRQRGAVAITVAFLMLALLGFGAIAIDLGYLLVERNELQNDVDAAALAGAPCLFQRSVCGNLTATQPDWTTATNMATSAIKLNKSGNMTMTQGTVTYGYWNLTGTPSGLQPLPYTPGANDLPAVSVKVSRSTGQNGGPVSTFLAWAIGVSSEPVSAQAVAAISYPGNVGNGGLFPVAMSQCMYNTFWDSTNNKPKTATSATPPSGQPSSVVETAGQPYMFAITSSYHAGPCEAGQWTTFGTTSNDVPYIQSLISDGNPTPVAIGQSPGTYMTPGTKTVLYNNVNSCSAAGNGSCEYVTVPVVSSLATGAYQPVVAFACLKIDSATGGSNKYIVVEMSNNSDKCQTKGGSGIGPAYGALTPPHLVQ
ncbi:hypothetical protein FAZ69_20035 [Trinickia terrae]|uniref:Pilus assembly protein TadG n=1 Tax=Trinickia terrae TaxID=2571161 RepID=A0A4U1I1A3_9BURK|nr:TadG family pilus assembly protein [Trinickia terrae]TKC86916.1 hypothetical protein FAZ69_20035 [Trinickia terrae]